jgi:Uma2 family endonuclease
MANREPIVVETEPTYYTAEMVRALVDEERPWPRVECVYGELVVTPGPAEPHQLVVARLVYVIARFIEEQGLAAVVYPAPADISWGRDDVTVQPDVFVVPRDMAREAHRTGGWSAIRHLLLAIEVLSESSRTADRFTKRRLYQDRAVPCYWIVDPRARVADVWTPERHFPIIERERLVWHPEGAAEPLVVDLATLFAEP